MSWEFHWMRNGQKLFHRHDDLLVYIMDIDHKCDICDEEIPEGIKIQALLINGKNYFWQYGDEEEVYLTDLNATDKCIVVKKITSNRFELNEPIDHKLRRYAESVNNLLKKYGKLAV